MIKKMQDLKYGDIFFAHGRYRFIQTIDRVNYHSFLIENVATGKAFESMVSPTLEVEVEELPPYKPELIPLAEVLNAARIEANRHEATKEYALQADIENAFLEVLRIITGVNPIPANVYDTIIEQGKTVIETLRLWKEGDL